MARNGAGVYSLPAGLPANGETSNATDDILTPFQDIETDLNTARPVVAGGTGATSASAARTNLGLVIGTDVQAYDAGLSDIAALAVTDGNVIVGDGANWVAESGATARTSLGLAIGTDVQAYDAELAALAGLTSAADKIPYFTGSGTAGLLDLETTITDVDTAVPTSSAVNDLVHAPTAVVYGANDFRTGDNSNSNPASNDTDGVVVSASNFLGAGNTGASALRIGRNEVSGAGTLTVAQIFRNGSQVGGIDTTGSATSFVTSSDGRLKQNVRDTTQDSLALIRSVRIRDFEWERTGQPSRGVIAQEVAALPNLPEGAVCGSADGFMGVDYSKFVPDLIKAVQQLTARIEALES